MQKQTIAGLTYNMVEAPSGSKRFMLVGPDAKVYAFETAAQRWDMIDCLRSQLEDAPVTEVKPTGLGRSAADIRALKATPDHKSFGERFESRYHTEEK